MQPKLLNSSIRNTCGSSQDSNRSVANYYATELRHVICEQVKQIWWTLSSESWRCRVDNGRTALMYLIFHMTDYCLTLGINVTPINYSLVRQDLFSNLRQRNGMSGFPSPDESPFDLFAVGHAGTSQFQPLWEWLVGIRFNGEAYDPETNP